MIRGVQITEYTASYVGRLFCVARAKTGFSAKVNFSILLLGIVYNLFNLQLSFRGRECMIIAIKT